MPTLTPDQLAATSYGYLTGQDLIDNCSVNVLIKQYETNQNILVDGCNAAYSEMIGYFKTKYDVQREFNMVSGPRQDMVVRLTAIFAIRNILRNMAGLGDVTKGNFAWADDIVMRTLDGVFNLNLYAADISIVSGAGLVRQNFGTLG